MVGHLNHHRRADTPIPVDRLRVVAEQEKKQEGQHLLTVRINNVSQPTFVGGPSVLGLPPAVHGGGMRVPHAGAHTFVAVPGSGAGRAPSAGQRTNPH